MAFAVFLPSFVALFYLVRPERRRWLLLIGSYFFYGWWDWRFCGLILLSTVVDYLCGLNITRSPDQRRRRLILALSVATNLGLLGVFKYFNFMVDSAHTALAALGFAADLPTLSVLVPVGISFYTFQTLSYTIDVYRGRPAERSFVDFANYVAFFPQLVAGPIMRADELLPQLKARTEADTDDLSAAVTLILRGLIKKSILADNLAIFVDTVFANPSQYASPTCWFATYAYAFQIYLDFSGYTDIALGTARLFGVRLITNFDSPYVAAGPSDFWHRWHISLSTWIRDYVYIPLGGSRGGKARTLAVLMITMGLAGLWHGAAWTFVVWGIYHGLLLAGERAMGLRPRRNETISPGTRAVRVMVMFHLTCLGWVIFRAESLPGAWTMLSRMFVWQAGETIGRRFAVLTLFCAVLHLIGASRKRLSKWRPAPELQGALAALTAVGLLVMAPDAVPFLYFQF